MLDYSEYRPKNRSCLTGRIGIRKQEWIPIALAVAAYLMVMGIGCLRAGFLRQVMNP